MWKNQVLPDRCDKSEHDNLLKFMVISVYVL